MRYITIVLLVCTMYPSTHVPVVTAMTSGDSCQYEGVRGDASFVFRDVEPKLRRSGVAPRLPSFLPGIDAEHPVYAVLKSADASGYEILLANALPCEGQNVCLYGTIRGGTSPFSKRGTTAMLKRHIRGKFIAAVCHAYCTQSYINWSEGGFYYSIGIKAEKEENLVKAANSAIPGIPGDLSHRDLLNYGAFASTPCRSCEIPRELRERESSI